MSLGEKKAIAGQSHMTASIVLTLQWLSNTSIRLVPWHLLPEDGINTMLKNIQARFTIKLLCL